MKRRIALCTEYVGTNYAGWQVQENAITVQGVLEIALSKLCKEPIKVYGCSRTDAGVHALGHICHFETSSKVPTNKLYLALLQHLPSDITVKAASDVPSDFHARFSCSGKRYLYRILLSPSPSALRSDRTYYCPKPLDFKAMQTAASYIQGTRDFSSFCAAGSDAQSHVRTVHSVDLSIVQDELHIRVSGDGFLYNMVRIIAGTLLYVGQGKLQADDIIKILEEKDRRLAGKTLGPSGLYLEEVFYPESISFSWIPDISLGFLS